MPYPIRPFARLAAAGAALAAACSCVPARQAGFRLTIPVPDRDQSLLGQLALADPLAKPATARGASPFAAAPPFLAALGSEDGRRAADCLTAAVYYEARSEPIDGQRAVAQVVLNRVRDRAFPASVCGVVYQRSAAGCQFTFACDGSMARPVEPRAWGIAQAVAGAALGGSVYAPVGAATHYHASYVSPWWGPRLARIAAVGSHVFYRWRDALAAALTFRQAYAGREAMPALPPVTVAAAAGDGAVGGAGVTVHRGGDLGTGTAPDTTLADAAPPAQAPAVAGVTVHRGFDPGIDDAGTP